MKHLKNIRLDELNKRYGKGHNRICLIIGTGVTKVPGLENIIELKPPYNGDTPGDESQYGHETLVASLIKQVAPKAMIYSIDCESESPNQKSFWHTECLQEAVRLYDSGIKFDVINCSWSWDSGSLEMIQALVDLKNRNVIVTCASGNKPDKSYYPAMYGSLVISVGSCVTGHINKISNFTSRPYDILLPGDPVCGLNSKRLPLIRCDSGTSLACPLATGMLLCYKNEDVKLNKESGIEFLKKWMKQ